ncbi:DNA-directed RNA polymerase subunit P [Candidatus Geothermarchaeota archaeon]|nr:MAG: DNA-directed RNA polymerase subunit P [Candidatus Geothermarchaeota archaeon]
MYICLKCGYENKSEELASLGFLHCLNCGYEVLIKKRSSVVKHIKAR